MRLRPLRVLRTVWIIAGLSFTLWLYAGFQALSVPDVDRGSGPAVVITETDQRITFQPQANSHRSGLIFLPGAMVDPAAYAPLLRKVARAGYPAYLIPLPARSAWTESQVRSLFSQIQQVLAEEGGRSWILAGHSRGGMLAARFVHENSTDLGRLILIATTHPRDYSLAGITIPVTKIYGTRDGVASYAQMRENQHLLPQKTRWIEIDGGNHVQFGYYRHQLGDNDATISLEDQQRLLEAALLEALSSASHTGVEPAC